MASRGAGAGAGAGAAAAAAADDDLSFKKAGQKYITPRCGGALERARGGSCCACRVMGAHERARSTVALVVCDGAQGRLEGRAVGGSRSA